MSMADLIAARRKEKGMTQKQLADKLGVTDKAVSKWERGNGQPDINYLLPLADSLGIPVGELLKGEAGDSLPNADAEDADEEIIVQKALDYASSVYEARSRNYPRMVIFCFLALGLVGIITTSIVDFALNGRFTWSPLPISAILYSWLCVAPLLYFKKHRLDMVLLSASVFLFPLLYAICALTGGNWFVPVGVVMALSGVALLWLIRAVFATRLNIWNKLAVSVSIGAVGNIVIDFVLGRVLFNWEWAFTVWDVMALAILLVLVIIFFALGRAKRPS